LLYDWGIHHIHFAPGGTKDLLFACISPDTAYFITIMDHEKEGGSIIWANSDLIEIIHNNWPEILVPYRYKGKENSNITNELRSKLRKSHGNSLIS
jgi:hypothetical protein